MAERISVFDPEQLALSDRFSTRVVSMARLDDSRGLGSAQNNEEFSVPSANWLEDISTNTQSATYVLANPVHALGDSYQHIRVSRFGYECGTMLYSLELLAEPEDEAPTLSLYLDSDDNLFVNLEPSLGFDIDPLPLTVQPSEQQQIIKSLFKETLDQLDATVAFPIDN